jgi:hypothetical protein
MIGTHHKLLNSSNVGQGRWGGLLHAWSHYSNYAVVWQDSWQMISSRTNCIQVGNKPLFFDKLKTEDPGCVCIRYMQNIFKKVYKI